MWVLLKYLQFYLVAGYSMTTARIRRRGLLARLRRSQRGAALVEFGFVFPILLIAVTGTMELMGILFATALMEGGLREASRFGITGYTPTGVSREQQIVDIVNRDGIGLVKVNLGDVSTKVYSTFTDVGQPEPWVDANGNGVYDLGEFLYRRQRQRPVGPGHGRGWRGRSRRCGGLQPYLCLAVADPGDDTVHRPRRPYHAACVGRGPQRTL